MDKKITMQDVADAAGVSKSTVSFILNHREDQRISEDTKQKVWQVINMLNFKPNTYAKFLRGAQPDKLVAAYCPQDLTDLGRIVFLDFYRRLSEALSAQSVRVFHLCSPARLDTVEAIVTYGVSKEEFSQLGGLNFVPVVSVNCTIGDALFFEISNDYAALARDATAHFGAHFLFVSLPPRDEYLLTAIESSFSDVRFISNLCELTAFKGQYVVTDEPSLAALLNETAGANAYCPARADRPKIQKIVECVRLATDREPHPEHRFFV